MITYPWDDYDNNNYGNIGFSENYTNPEYCKWLEELAVKLISGDRHIGILDYEAKLKTIGNSSHFSDELYARIEDARIRREFPLLENFPLCCASACYQGEEEIRKVNEWEIQTVARLAQEMLEETNHYVKPEDYRRLLRELEPYSQYFLEGTWKRLREDTFARYASFRIDKTIPWSEMSSHPENICLDLNILVWGDTREERFLSIDADISSPIFLNLIGQG